MGKNKIIRRTNKPLNIFAEGGPIGSIAKSTDLSKISQLGSGGAAGSVGMQSSSGTSSGLGGAIGGIGSSVGTILNASLANAQIADTSTQETQIKAQKNMTVGSNDLDSLMSEWGSWNKSKDDYSYKDIRGGSTGQRLGNTISATASGAATGASVGGPVGAIIGGVVGLGSSVAGWISGNKKAKRKAKRLNQEAREANERALASFGTRAENIDTQNDLNLLANYSAFGGMLGGAVDYELANKALNNKQLDVMSKFRLPSMPNSFESVEFDGKFYANGGELFNVNPMIGDSFGVGLQNSINRLAPDTQKVSAIPSSLSHMLKDGGGIHIKKANKGKFTEYCGGNVTSSCIAKGKRSNSSAVRKMATFADNARKWHHAYGGLLNNTTLYQDAYNSTTTNPNSFSNGGDFGNGVTIIGNGGIHEENPLTGVPMGVAPDGTPNLVEEGEVIFNDYVFSNRLHPSEELLKQMSLPSKYKDNTFANIAEKINKESSERPNDPISKRGLLSNMSKLMQAQEEVKAIKDNNPNGRQFAEGGNTNTWDNTLLSDNPFTWEDYAESQVLPNEDITSDSKTSKLGLDALRYAPALGAGVGVISDLLGWTNKPDYSNAGMIMDSVKGLPTIESKPLGNYLGYNPFDRDYYINKLNAESGATRSALQNTSGGNRLNAQAGILAADYNYGQNLGDLARKAEEYNMQQRERVEAFNRGTNQFNSESAMKAAIANQANKELQLKGIMAAAQLKEDAASRSSSARSANLTNFFDSLGDIGREEFSRNMIESNPAYNYTIGRNGKVKYKKTNKKGK